MAVLSRGHVLLDDVPGAGKTTTALAFSRALGLRYGRVQFTLGRAALGHHRLLRLPTRRAAAFVYQPGAVMTNLLLADEINRTSSKTQSALLEVMEERQVTVDGQTHHAARPLRGHRYAEPRWLRRHAAAAPGTAGSLHGAPGDGLPRTSPVR